jgi:hypothetical protein
MRGIEGEQVLLRIYLGESKRGLRGPLHRQLLELLRQEGLAGATTLKGCVGYGHDRVVHAANIECRRPISPWSSRPSTRPSTSSASSPGSRPS